MRVQVNGRLGVKIQMRRGLRQGCPLSQILFACIQDPFYRAIRRCVAGGGEGTDRGEGGLVS